MIDPNYPIASRGDLVRADGPRGARGVYVGVSPSGVSWVRWLKNGELRGAKAVQDDVRRMAARLDKMNARKKGVFY